MSRVLGILKYALSREKEGNVFYKNNKDKVKNAQLKEIFENLAEMEYDHMKYIQELIDTTENGNKKLNEVIFEEDNSFFETRKKNEIVEKDIEDMTSDLSILRMAYLIEEDFKNFYENAAKNIEDKDAIDILNKLANWEKTHRDTLYQLYRDMMKDYWDEMGFEPLY
ncbi:MAG: ferritin-like domain-containing protein [Thermotogota bacterium]